MVAARRCLSMFHVSNVSQRALLCVQRFDAGEFHVGFGIVMPPDEETTEFSIEGVTRNSRAPFRRSLAVTLCGDCLLEVAGGPLQRRKTFSCHCRRGWLNRERRRFV
jgi:hypothetical protein